MLPRQGFNRIFNSILSVVDRYLTFITLGIVAVGVVLIATGPAGGLFGVGQSRPVERGGQAAEEPLDGEADGEEPSAPLAVLLAPGGDSDEGEQGTSQVIERAPEPFTIVPDRQRDEIITYTIEAGDTIFDLSAQYDISGETIFWANSETLQDDVHLLTVGTGIYILPVNGVYYRAGGQETVAEIASRFLALAEAILDSPYNELPEGSAESFKPALGMRLIVPGGQREKIDFQWIAPVADSGSSGSSAAGSFAPGHPGSCAPINGAGGTGSWARPINRYTVTTPFFYGHNGLDLSAPTGEPVLAADSGIVVFSGWNDWGYGNLVVLDHGNGWTTYYAHMSSVSVGCGRLVSRGSTVGGVGSTGNSSGPHLHFEMRWLYNADNPAAYIAF